MKRSRLSALLTALALLTGCATSNLQDPAPETEPRIQFSDNPARFGDPVGVRVTGLAPEQTILIRAERPATSGWNRLYRTEARFIADKAGVVDLATDAPIDGPWSEADINGLFWSMRNSDREVPDDLPRDHVPVEVLDTDGNRLAASTLVFEASETPLIETPLGDAFPGAFVLREPGDDPLPAIIVLGGSEGGDMTARRMAPMFAARGYAAVGYPYYSPSWPSGTPAIPELPEGFANLPLDKLIGVRDALRQRSDIDGDRIGLYGVSKGAEFVLAAASRIDGFSAVSAIVPSDVIWEGWGAGHTEGATPGFSWQGEPLPFVPYVDIARGIGQVPEDERVPLRVPHAEGRERYAERVDAARIRVEDIDEPVFVLGGGRDQTWDSGIMATHIAERRTRAGLETETLVFANAGHSLSSPPQFPARTSDVVARTAGWPAMLQFFERHLKAPD